MRVELYRSEAPDTVVATATWRGSSVSVDGGDDALRVRIVHAFRPTPAVVDDASYRQQGTRGETVVQPGSLEWFRAVVQTRVTVDTGLAARFAPGITEGGYDPAAQYRTFQDSIARLAEGAD
ncbi:MAG: hypothetical protein H0W82_10340 [Actinobacteria bacterium]|nr:hypothetical protein [Actinomycetota bacterium]